jgi:UrcA family protein
MNMSSKARIWINAAAVLLAGAWQFDAAAADAPASAEGNQTTVYFGDLNVDHGAGAAVLYRRIRHAAMSVCGDPILTGSPFISRSWRNCVADAINRAVLAVDRPALTAYYRLHTKPSDQDASTALAALSQGQSGR